MRIVNLAGRLALLRDGRAVDVRRAGAGRFAADPQAVYERRAEFRAWADTADLPEGSPSLRPTSARPHHCPGRPSLSG